MHGTNMKIIFILVNIQSSEGYISCGSAQLQKVIL